MESFEKLLFYLDNASKLRGGFVLITCFLLNIMNIAMFIVIVNVG